MYFYSVDLLNCTWVFARCSQGINRVCRDTAHTIVFQQFGNLEEPTGFTGVSNNTWMCGDRFLLSSVLEGNKRFFFV